jgi:hypothetical protein
MCKLPLVAIYEKYLLNGLPMVTAQFAATTVFLFMGLLYCLLIQSPQINLLSFF